MPEQPASRFRSDSRRNHEAIVTAAIAVLADVPQASMSDIAAASGIGRTTLYRHFPDRRALVAAIYARVLAEAEALSSEILQRTSEEPIAVLEEMAVALASLGDRYRFIGHHEAAELQADPEANPGRGEPLHAFLDAAQRRGAITAGVSVDWLFAVLVALITEASRPPFRDTADRNAMLITTLRQVLSP